MQIYVNAKARCDGDGSKERPFKRINDAAKIAMPGDEVLVLPGVYREYVNPIHSGTAENRSRDLQRIAKLGCSRMPGRETYVSCVT